MPMVAVGLIAFVCLEVSRDKDDGELEAGDMMMLYWCFRLELIKKFM
jgi:hypothetical protein